jgi:MerT mercuric transport protein
MLGATLCCFSPLVTLLGLDAAWARRLQSLEPLQPLFLVFAAGYMSFAFYDLYIFPRHWPPTMRCAPEVLRRRRLAFWICAALMLAMLGAASFGGARA